MVVEPVRARDIELAVSRAVDGSVARVSAVDITFFDAEGNEIQPAAPVRVTMTTTNSPSTGEVAVVHVDGEGSCTVVEQAEAARSNDQVTFDAESFSVYAMVIIDADADELSFETEHAIVTVSYTAEAEIPYGTELSVREISPDSDRYWALWSETIEKMNEGVTWDEGQERDPRKGLTDAMFFDITLNHNGDVIEPKVPLQVSIQYKDGGVLLPKGEDPLVVHFASDGTEIINDVQTEGTSAKDLDLPKDLRSGVVAESFTYQQGSFSIVGTGTTSKFVDINASNISNPAFRLTATRDGESHINATKNVEDLDGDGVYELQLTVEGSSTSSENASVDKSNIVLVIDRSSSMETYNGEVYVPYTYSPATYNANTEYYRRVNNTYSRVYYRNGAWRTSNNNYGQTYTGQVYRESTRLAETKTAAINLVDALFANNKNETITHINDDGTETEISLTDVIEISLVTFGTTATSNNVHYSGTVDSSSATQLKNAINNIEVTPAYWSYTNWEHAFQIAKNVADTYSGQTDENTTVIFLTDGRPTVYNTNGGGGNGQETDANVRNCWNAADEDARNIVTSGYALYNIFAFGGSDAGQNYLRAMTNYAYTGQGTYNSYQDSQYVRDYFFNARDAASVAAAFQKIINNITEQVGYGGVEYDDGVTLGVSNTSVAIDGQTHEDCFRYSVRSGNALMYSVKIDADGVATFSIPGHDDVTVATPETVVTKIDPADESTWITSTVYKYVADDGTEYAMSPAHINASNGLIEWDLAGLGILENGFSYTLACDMWPNQWSYDLVADLNNGVKTIEQAEAEVVNDPDKGQAVWDQIQAALVGPDENGQYAVRTNWDQYVNYYKVDTEEIEEGGETTTTTTYERQPTYTFEYNNTMALTSKPIPLEKVWNSDLSPDQIGNILYRDYPTNSQPTEYQVTLHVWKADTATELQSLIDQYAGDPTTASQHDYLEKTLGWNGTEYNWFDSLAIAPGTMVSLLTAQDMGLTIDPQKVVHYDKDGDGDNEDYYIIETGHYYYVTEDNIDWHFELETVLYHPMMVDGTLSNVTFITDNDGNITGVEDIEDLTQVSATNSKTAELDITKKVVDETGKMTKAQQDAETFTYKVTLTVPADADMSHTNLLEWVPRYNDDVSASNRYYIYGYQTSEAAELLGFEDDVTHFNQKVYGQYTVSYPGGGATLNEMFTPENGVIVNQDGTLTNSIYVTLTQNEVIRLTNLPSGTRYEIEEIYANLKQADPSRDADAKPTSSDPASNVAAQGYNVSIRTKNGEPTASGRVVTGTIDELDKRYYNQFTNTRTETPGNLWAEIKVYKVVEGYEWLNEFYRFFLIPRTATYTDEAGGTGTSPIKATHTLNGEDVTRVDLYEATNDHSHVISFGNVQFTRPGTYEYEIRENDNSANMPYVKFAEPVRIAVTVERGQDGLLHITGVTDNSGIEGNSFMTEGTETTLESTTTTMTNKVVTTTADANKEWLDANGRTIAADEIPDGVTATFELYADGEPTGKTVVLNGVVDEDGELEPWVATFADLPKYVVTTGDDGTTRTYTEIVYTIAETEVSEAFVKVTEDPVPNHGTIQNKQLPIGVSLQKIGNADFDNLLSDVSFKLYSDEELETQVTTDAMGNQVGSADGTITTVDGVANIGTLAAGTYYLVETVPAGGYVALTSPVTITVTGTPEGQRVSYQQADFDASMDGRGLFKVYTHEVEGQQQEVKVDCAQGTDDPYAEDEAYTFAGYRITVNNTSGAELPKSGGVGTQLILAIGAGMIAAAAMVLFYRRRGIIAL